MDLNQDTVPVTLDEAVMLVRKALSPEDVRSMIKAKCIDQFERTLGEQIRNDWSLWDADSRLRNWFRTKFELNHADDVSGLILTCVLADVQDYPNDSVTVIQDFVNFVHARWLSTIGKLMP